jgi:hypothetical protein
VLAGAAIAWITAPYHGLDVAWVALIGLTLVTASNLLDRAAFRAAIFWDFLFYLAARAELDGVVRHLAIDQWLIHSLEPALATAGRAAGLVPDRADGRDLRGALHPAELSARLAAHDHGGAARDPRRHRAARVLLVISTAVSVWFLPYQSAYYLALYFGTKEQAFTHRQVRPVAWSYGAIYLLAVIVAIPFWRALGLVP